MASGDAGDSGSNTWMAQGVRYLGQLVQAVQSLGATTIGVTTVAALPAAASSQGQRRLVTDANATTFNSVVAAGGTNIVPVFSNGSSWRIG